MKVYVVSSEECDDCGHGKPEAVFASRAAAVAYAGDIDAMITEMTVFTFPPPLITYYYTFVANGGYGPTTRTHTIRENRLNEVAFDTPCGAFGRNAGGWARCSSRDRDRSIALAEAHLKSLTESPTPPKGG